MCVRACVYVCMQVCICMYACMYVCMYVYMYVCMYVCMPACMHPCMYACMYVCMHVCMYLNQCTMNQCAHANLYLSYGTLCGIVGSPDLTPTFLALNQHKPSCETSCKETCQLTYMYKSFVFISAFLTFRINVLHHSLPTTNESKYWVT